MLQRVSVPISELEFDVLAMCLDRLAADAKLLRNPTNPLARSN
jgi:hypothetical protein